MAKKIGREPDQYENKPAHVALLEKVREKYGVEAAPKVGSFIYYIVFDNRTTRSKKVTDNIMWYPEAVREEVRPDADYYFKKDIAGVLKRLLVHIVEPVTIRMLFDRNRYARQTSVTINGETRTTSRYISRRPLRIVPLGETNVQTLHSFFTRLDMSER